MMIFHSTNHQTHGQTARSTLGLTIIELLVSMIVIIALAGVIAPGFAKIRSDSRAAQSAANLMAIGQSRDMYAKDSDDRIFTYTWRAGETYIMPDGRVRNPGSTQTAASYQNQEILMRRTGRISGQYKIQSNFSHLFYRRSVHIVLMDYMAGEDDNAFPSDTFVDPEHGDLLNWHERPLSYLSISSGIPYVNGPPPQGYEDNPSWGNSAVRQRWAFASSYFSVPAAWQPDGFDGEPVYYPLSSTPHLFGSSGSVDLSGRFMNQVMFPAQKVHMFEEFDREQKRYPYFAYDHAMPDKLMFDGSINSQITGDSNSAVNPNDPANSPWRTTYVPLDAHPVPVEGLTNSPQLDMHYMWTDLGLRGVDYNATP